MKLTIRQIHPPLLTWTVLLVALFWSIGADRCITVDYQKMEFYPLTSVVNLILLSALLSFIGGALVIKEQRDTDSEVLSYTGALYAFFLVCFTSGALWSFMFVGGYIVPAFKAGTWWWMILLLSTLIPALYAGALSPSGPIRLRSHAA